MATGIVFVKLRSGSLHIGLLYRLCSLVMAMLVGVFYVWQNHVAQHGGAIAFPKALWLGLTIFCWLILPPLMMQHSQYAYAKRVWRNFWYLMLVRAVAEMWLLYGVNQWKYSYGMAHDALSVVVLYVGWQFSGSLKKLPEVKQMLVMAMMFVCEMGFAYYIAQFNQNVGYAKLWFIDWRSEHWANLLITCWVEMGLLYWLWRLDSLFFNREN